MRGLDDTDRQILDHLLADGRRPYSEIADDVGLSAPAVSDRVDRLQEMGLIRRFTVDVDRSLLQSGVPVLVTFQTTPGDGERLRDALVGMETVEHVFRTADGTVVCTATLPADSVATRLESALPFDAVQEYDVSVLAARGWEPGVGDSEFAPDCVECGNTVTSEGEQEQFDGQLYHFCCNSCLQSFTEQYESLQEGV